MRFRENEWCRLPMTRRRVLQLLSGAAAVALQPRLLARAGTAGTAAPGQPYGFLSADELGILDAATSVLLPTDDRPGAREIGVVDYIQGLLSFLPGADANCDRRVSAADVIAVEGKVLGQYPACPDGGDVTGDQSIDQQDVVAAEAAVFRAKPAFGGGPFSGRNPQLHFPIGNTPCSSCHGVSSGGGAVMGLPAGEAASSHTVDVYPYNKFREFLPLNRLQRLSWKVRILGAEAVPELADNALLSELPEVDLRNRYRTGLAELETASQQRYGASFVTLIPRQQEQLLSQAPTRFLDLLYRHVIQGTFCPPEYGGNRDKLGWQLAGFDGDSQPLGYEIYDESVPGYYREREDKPDSQPDPNEPCSGFSSKMKGFLGIVSGATGGRQFADPYCFEVDR